MIKGIVFDLDGVLVQEHCYFSQLFQKLYGVPHEEFYQVMKDNKMLQRTKDQGSNFTLFNNLLKKYKVEISEKKFWELWLTNFKVNQDVIDFALSLKKSGKKIGILSDNFVERAEYLRENLDWFNEFDANLFSCDVALTKHDPEFFRIILDKLEVKPEETVFIDDDEDNASVARSVGINGIKFEGLEGLKIELTDVFEDDNYFQRDKKQYKSYKKGWKRKYK